MTNPEEAQPMSGKRLKAVEGWSGGCDREVKDELCQEIWRLREESNWMSAGLDTLREAIEGHEAAMRQAVNRGKCRCDDTQLCNMCFTLMPIRDRLKEKQ